MNCVDVVGVPEARAQELIDATTSAIYSHMSTVLFADHRDLLALLLSLDRLHTTHRLTDAESSMWMSGLVSETSTQAIDDDARSCWLSRQVLFVSILQLHTSLDCGMTVPVLRHESYVVQCHSVSTIVYLFISVCVVDVLVD